MKKYFVLALAVVSLWAGSAFAATPINLQRALPLVDAAYAKAVEIKVPMVISIVNPSGIVVALHRMDDALPVSSKLAPKKGQTALALKMDTADLAAAVQPGASLYGLQNDPDLVVFGGGMLLKEDGVIVGAVGVSGGSVEEDMSVAKAAVDAFNASLKAKK